MSTCDATIHKSGDDIIIPIGYAQGSIASIVNFESFTKIEIVVSSKTDNTFLFSTDAGSVDAEHLITFDTPTNFDLIIPKADTLFMLGDIELQATYYFTYKGKDLKSTSDTIKAVTIE